MSTFSEHTLTVLRRQWEVLRKRMQKQDCVSPSSCQGCNKRVPVTPVSSCVGSQVFVSIGVKGGCDGTATLQLLSKVRLKHCEHRSCKSCRLSISEWSMRRAHRKTGPPL